LPTAKLGGVKNIPTVIFLPQEDPRFIGGVNCSQSQQDYSDKGTKYTQETQAYSKPLSRWFEFWLKDQQIISNSKNFKGLAILMGCLVVIVAIFYTTSDSDPGTVSKTLQTVPKRLLG
jgi:hypothetical protein